MGRSYVNDFDFNNRSYRVYVQADKQFRAKRKTSGSSTCGRTTAAMVPLDNLITIAQATTPQVISHYNLFRSVEIDGSPAPGLQFGPGDRGHGGAVGKNVASGHTLTSGLACRWKKLQSGGNGAHPVRTWNCWSSI